MPASTLRVHRPLPIAAEPVLAALSALAAAIGDQVEAAAVADVEPAAPPAPDPRLDAIVERLDRMIGLAEALLAEAKATHQATARIAPPPDDRRLTLADLAERLRRDYRTITRMRSAGKLPDGERVGREYLYRADVIDAWLAAGTPDNATWRAMGGGGPTMRMPKDTPTGAPPLDAVPTTWHVPPELLAMRGIRREPLLAYIVLWQVVGCRPRKLTVDYLRLQRAMAASERAVRRWIETLAARGLIVVEAREPRQATIAVRDWRAAHDPAATRADAQLRLPIGDDSDDDADIAPIPIWHHRRPAGRRPDGPTPAG